MKLRLCWLGVALILVWLILVQPPLDVFGQPDPFFSTSVSDPQKDLPGVSYLLVPCPDGLPASANCGELSVPEDRRNPTGRNITLAVAILHSPSPASAQDPLVILEGGPGGSGLSSAGWWNRSPLLKDRDIILFDQRGAGYSQPALGCPEIDNSALQIFHWDMNPSEEVAFMQRAARECRERLIQEGIDLSAYNTAASAEDLKDLRLILGYSSWNLYGISYGTRLALSALRSDPQGIRSVILDSVYPFGIHDFVQRLPKLARSLHLLFYRCAADPHCNSAYPDLERRFVRLIENLNQEPLVLTIPRAPWQEPFKVNMTGDGLAMGIYKAFYDPAVFIYLPYLIGELESGNQDVVVPLVQNGLQMLRSVDTGMYYSVQCHDEAPVNRPQDVQEAGQVLPMVTNHLGVDVDFAICQAWNVKPASPEEISVVTSSVPTLLLSGEMDPTTPPEYAALASQTLQNSYAYTFPGLGHGVLFDSQCAVQMAKNFLVYPDQPPDSSCIQNMPPLSIPATAGMRIFSALFRLKHDWTAGGWGRIVLLMICILIYLWELFLWGVRFSTQSEHKRLPLSRLLMGAAALLNIGLLVGLLYLAARANLAEELKSTSTLAAFLLALPRLSIFLCLILLSLTGLDWAIRRKRPLESFYLAVFAMVTLVFVLQLWHYGLV